MQRARAAAIYSGARSAINGTYSSFGFQFRGGTWHQGPIFAGSSLTQWALQACMACCCFPKAPEAPKKSSQFLPSQLSIKSSPDRSCPRLPVKIQVSRPRYTQLIAQPPLGRDMVTPTVPRHEVVLLLVGKPPLASRPRRRVVCSNGRATPAVQHRSWAAQAQARPITSSAWGKWGNLACHMGTWYGIRLGAWRPEVKGARERTLHSGGGIDHVVFC